MKTYDDPELQAIAVKLTSEDPGIRRVAVMDLVDSGEPEAVELVIQALNDPDTNVRQEAAKVVDEFEAADMADALIAALSDNDEVVRNSAAHALAAGAGLLPIAEVAIGARQAILGRQIASTRRGVAHLGDTGIAHP